ncbi:MAG: site-specific DNA-methyltransferase [Chloroflexi bacterium]|nr:site-specific DNA-methyltransferase [Chloroflexota bacterium]
MFDIAQHLTNFIFAGERTRVETVTLDGARYPRFVNEFWTARQRQAASLHEVAYRACFKPQLPRFFIELLTTPNDIVYDPFSGRGTTALEAGLLGRNVIANDINPLSAMLTRPRFFVPDLDQLADRLATIPINPRARAEVDLTMFYHPRTLAEIISLRKYLRARRDHLATWIRMIATNRLTGHSPGFFSVYTLPPNQAVSPVRQIRINSKRQQIPVYRDTRALILKKSRQLIAGLSADQIETLARVGRRARLLTRDARATRAIANETIQLTVTSPPFLDIVQYAQDNWLRGWFNGIDAHQVAQKITTPRTVAEWAAVMQQVFVELFRITRAGGWVAFEVGEVRGGQIKLDEIVAPLGVRAGFACRGILVNQQTFTKTANIWGVKNNARGTNTNRVVLFAKR